MVAFADARVHWISNTVQSSGAFGECGYGSGASDPNALISFRVWDRLIGSQDGFFIEHNQLIDD